MDWILYSERSPETGQEVLVTYGNRVIITYYEGPSYGFTCGLVDAWMPLPEPYQNNNVQ